MQMARTDVVKGKSFAAGAGTPVPRPMPRMAIQARREEEEPEPDPAPEPAPEPEPEPESEPEPEPAGSPSRSPSGSRSPKLEAVAEQSKPPPLLPFGSLSSDSPGRVTANGTPRTPTTPSLMPDFRASQVGGKSVVKVSIPNSSSRATHTDYMVQCSTADNRT